MSDRALDLLAMLVLEDGRRWGDAAVSAQWSDARAVLDPSGAPYNFLTRARGYSKTSDLAGIAIAAMLTQLSGGSRLYGLAADRDQGRLLVDSVNGFAARTPELGGALTVDSYKVTSASGSVLEVLPADAAGAYGLRPALLIVDELAQWESTAGPRRLWEATTSAMAKIAGSRLVALTSAGDPAHWSHGVLEHAYRDPLWRVNEIAGPPPWADTQRLAEQRRRLPESVYLRLFENQWQSAEDRLSTLDDLRACATLPGPLEPRAKVTYTIGCDLGLKKDRTAVAVCHAERLDAGVRVVLDAMRVWEGKRLRPVRLGDVEEHLLAESRRFNNARVVIDPWQAAGLSQRLRHSGVRVNEFVFSQTSVGRLASALHTTIRDRRILLPDDEALIEELANVQLRETTPGVLRMDHAHGRHDDRAISIALAMHEFVESGLGVGAAFMEVWESEIAGRTNEEKVRAEHPEIRSLPRSAPFDRPIAGEKCRGGSGIVSGPSMGFRGHHQWERKEAGDQCKVCHLWKEGSLK
jgi:phage terminase large subunit-like protein